MEMSVRISVTVVRTILETVSPRVLWRAETADSSQFTVLCCSARPPGRPRGRRARAIKPYTCYNIRPKKHMTF
eukprot:scaffold129989_cov63-Phaeocystis_antarctica.AAC.5